MLRQAADRSNRRCRVGAWRTAQRRGGCALLRTEHGSPKPQPKSASPPASGDESPTAPPPPRGLEHGGGDSDDSEDDAQMAGSRGVPMSATSIAAMLAPMSP